LFRPPSGPTRRSASNRARWRSEIDHFIRETGPLPFSIVAPLLNASQGNSLFPSEYLDGVLAETQATYRVDPKRIYVTGLSLGGEATYRFAIQHPNTFAAIAPLSAWIEADQVSRLDRIKSLPVWAIHGANDEALTLLCHWL